jgi:hypothetical protein
VAKNIERRRFIALKIGIVEGRFCLGYVFLMRMKTADVIL